MAVWLVGWTIGGAVTIAALGEGRGSDAFLLAWMAAWALGEAFGLCVLIWSLAGREVIGFTHDAMVVTRVAGPYHRSKRFRRDRIERLRDDPYPGLARSVFARPRDALRDSLELHGLAGGSIVFDYGARTHRFGSKLDEAETRQLLELFRGELRL